MTAVETAGWHRYVAVRVDWISVALVGLFAVVIGGAFLVYPQLVASGTSSAVDGASTTEQATVGIGASILTVIEASLLLAAAALYRRAPGWARSVIRRTLPVAFWVVLGLYTAGTAGWEIALVGVPIAVAVVEAAKEHGLYWIINNVVALVVAIAAAASIGVRFGPVVVGVALVGLSFYDHYFADRKDWMFDLAGLLVRWKLPVLVILPTTLRFDWESLADGSDDEDARDDDRVGFAIGMADLLLPAALAVGLASTGGGLPVAGVILGTLAACFRLSHKMHQRGGAGLPALTTGAIGGWAGAILIAAAGGA